MSNYSLLLDNRKLMWKFFRDLLKSPQTNPSLVKWEIKTELIFIIVEPLEVSKKWQEFKGSKTKENNLCDSLARGMRYL